MPTAVPMATPQPAAGPLLPLLGGESAAAPVLAPGQAPALTPEVAPAPSPEPSLNAACAENGTNNGEHPFEWLLAVGCQLSSCPTNVLQCGSLTTCIGPFLGQTVKSPARPVHCLKRASQRLNGSWSAPERAGLSAMMGAQQWA